MTRFAVEPSEVVISGTREPAQVIATGHVADGGSRDLTRIVNWSSDQVQVATVSQDGRISPHANGEALISARAGSHVSQVKVRVVEFDHPRRVSFEHDVLPALTRAGCNQGACHGTPTGKNGFRLSLRGYDAPLDYVTLTHEADSRRINRLEPDASLVLLKGTGRLAHEGGPRFHPDGLPYRLVRDWIAQGVERESDSSQRLLRLEVVPGDRTIDAPGASQQLVVLAIDVEGRRRDVTQLARYETSDPTIAQVDPDGHVRRIAKGEVVILVSVEHLVAARTFIFRDAPNGFVWSDPAEFNFVDQHLFTKLRHLRIQPSGLTDDATFARRVFLDVTGLPPTVAELRRFLEDPRHDRRRQLIDELLERPEYVDFWTLKWVDRLGCNQRFVGHKGAYSYHRWVRDQIAMNRPFDQVVRAILVSKGSNFTNPPASFYRRLRDPQEAAESVSQLFLGVRLQCARCHNHVSERWTQDDYYGFAAFFGQVRFKNGPQTYAIYNKEETVFLDRQGEVVQPRTRQVISPKPLGAPASLVSPGSDRREALADWIVAPSNPYFARATVNRLWFHLFGRGIVEPVDDMRSSNPPASRELLDALAADFVAHGFDLKHTIRTILNSRIYQLDSAPNPSNAEDQRYFSHYPVRLLSAEQILDAASRVTEVNERFLHLPPGTRAAQLPDGELNHPFLRTFGQPSRAVACECERGTDTTLEQALQVVGGRTLSDKVKSQSNRLGRVLESGIDDSALVDDLFLAALGRAPSREERALALGGFRTSIRSRREVAEDLLWALLNHPEFLFQH
ncbi:MAG: DUF1553 domain-containing protein [Isosphaeraceae bacterium]